MTTNTKAVPKTSPKTKVGEMKKTPTKGPAKKETDKPDATVAIDPFDSKSEIKVKDDTSAGPKKKQASNGSASKPAEPKGDSASKPAEPKGDSGAKPAEPKGDSDAEPAESKGDSDAKPVEPKDDSDTPAEGEWVVNTTKFLKDTEIKFAANPKRNGCASWARYEKYSKAKTFGEYLELNAGKFSMADARYDVQKKFMTIRE